MSEKHIWVFQGTGGQFASGVFESRELAEKWIYNHKLQGVLTKYPLNIGVYDWALANGYFTPKREDQRSPEFIQRFSSASLEHYHYGGEEEN